MWFLIIDRRPFFNHPTVRKTPPLGDVRDVYLCIGEERFMWRIELPAAEVDKLESAARRKFIDVIRREQDV